jgi:hypothetical protein
LKFVATVLTGAEAEPAISKMQLVFIELAFMFSSAWKIGIWLNATVRHLASPEAV